MAIPVKCPNPACGKQHEIKDELAGKAIRCDACQTPISVPIPDVTTETPLPGVPTQPLSAGPPKPESPGLQRPNEPTRTVKRAVPTDPLIGAKIAHYQIQSLLGQGGMGKVYKAYNTSLAKTCAIKVLPQEFAQQDQTHIDRFVREARSAASVEHTNVLPVHFVGKVGPNYFIEMQYVDGGTLQGLLKQRKKLEVKEAARVIRDVAAGLQAAHEKGIVHRDIKPSNIMVTSKGHVFVMDFGLAKLAQTRSMLTASGVVMGTPHYMSPEQARGEPLDQRSDIYSLGVMFYQLLTGEPPFTGESPLALLYQHQTTPIPEITKVAPEVSPHIADMVRKMTAKDPKERYQSCAEIVQEMDGFLTTGGPTLRVSEDEFRDAPDHRKSVLTHAKQGATSRVGLKPGEDAAPKRRVPWPLIAGAIGAVAVIFIAGIYFLAKARTAAPPQPAIASGEAPKPSQAVDTASGKSPWDDLSITTAATGEKIPHPLSRKTYTITCEGKQVAVPEGMVYVPAGEFTMGEEASEHKVYLDAYFIGKHEVTNAEWKVFAEAQWQIAPDHWKGGKIPEGKENHPVVFVSWEAAKQYCDWVSKMTGRDVRLPTEAQWEKAAGWDPGKGVKHAYPWGDQWDPNLCNSGYALAKFGFHPNDEEQDWPKKWGEWRKSEAGEQMLASGGNTMPVGSFAQGRSAYGCYDMAGNADEWCSDWFLESYHCLKGANRNPQGPGEELAEEHYDSGKMSKTHVLRGGSWFNNSLLCRSPMRFLDWLPYRSAVSFRVAVSVPSQAMAPGTAAAAKGAETKPPTAPVAQPSAVQGQPKPSWDDVYVATAATGDKIPHPLSRKTNAVVVDGKPVAVPEGMVYVPPGEFTMGEGDKPSLGPQHKVWLDGYSIGKYEVTNAEWKAFVDDTWPLYPAHWKEGKIPEGKENHPVVCVAWNTAKQYCDWVSKRTGRDVRLPTEAQWEKAASWDPATRGKRTYPWGDEWDAKRCNTGYSLTQLGLEAKDDGENSWKKRKDLEKSEAGKRILASGGNTTPVGSFPQGRSAYGCYDMAGNAFEWCRDWFKRDYYTSLRARMNNPEGPSEDDLQELKYRARSERGGAWFFISGFWFRNTLRCCCTPAYQDCDIGLRIVVMGVR